MLCTHDFGIGFQVTVIEEAVKYIDELHRALFERLHSKGNIYRCNRNSSLSSVVTPPVNLMKV